MMEMEPILALCDYRIDPLGVQNPAPSFSWQLPPDCSLQEKYRVVVKSSADFDAGDRDSVWDSGTVCSSDSTCILYAGAPLDSRKLYYWRAEIWCRGSAEPVLSGISSFETAIMEDSEWKAAWIQAPSHVFGVSPLIRKEFTIHHAVHSSRIYICGLGYYQLYINGCRVGDHVLDPGWTNYAKTVLYTVYDVTGCLREGLNVVGIELGEGWYGLKHESIVRYTGRDPVWNSGPKLRLELDIHTVDGECIRIVSNDRNGFFASEGPVRQNSIYDGELYDATKEMAGWNDTGFLMDEAKWRPVIQAVPPGGRMRSQEMPPIRITQELEPFSEHRVTDRIRVIDFGRNFSGYVEIAVSGMRGSVLTMKYGETLYDSGRVNQENLRGASAMDTYILRGEEEERYHPHFTYHGFRFVEIECPADAVLLRVKGLVLHTAVDRISRFRSADTWLDAIYQAVLWTERSNLHSIPTDCPQRDERMAWLNDATVRCEEAVTNFDLALFYRNWLADIADEQTAEGSVPDTAPFVYGGNPAHHVSACIILIPWLSYLYYGDRVPMMKFYTNMRKYLLFLDSQAIDDGVITDGYYYGDWAAPQEFCYRDIAWDAMPMNMPNGIITTGYLYYCSILMEKMASLSGHDEDRPVFSGIASRAKDAINRRYLNTEKGYYEPNSQGSNIFPLFLGIVPEEYVPKVLSSLLHDLVDLRDCHITTGNQMTKYLFEVLDANGMNRIAYRILEQKTYPGIGYMIDKGATTVWERWEYLTGGGMNSHNHPMHGSFFPWIFKAVCGIRLDRSDGITDELILEPDTEIGPDSASMEYRTMKGLLCCAWEKKGSGVRYRLMIPWNLPATLMIRKTGSDMTIRFDGRLLLLTGTSEEMGKPSPELQWNGTKYAVSLCSGHHDIIVECAQG